MPAGKEIYGLGLALLQIITALTCPVQRETTCDTACTIQYDPTLRLCVPESCQIVCVELLFAQECSYWTYLGESNNTAFVTRTSKSACVHVLSDSTMALNCWIDIVTSPITFTFDGR